MAGTPRYPITSHASGGVPYRIRPIRADDAQRERDFIAALSDQSRYQRFMHHLRVAGESTISRLVNVDGHSTMALVGTVGEGDDERIVGVARYAADGARECEFAVVVADDWQCRGIGTTLVRLLFDHAAREGYEIIYGTVLADNQRMIDLAGWVGLTVDAPRPGESTVRAWRRLRAPAGAS